MVQQSRSHRKKMNIFITQKEFYWIPVLALKCCATDRATINGILERQDVDWLRFLDSDKV